MVKDTYIHGIGSAEQERLTLLNRLTNQSFIDFLALTDTRSILDIGSGLGILTEQVAELAPHSTVCGIEYFAEQLAATKARRRSNLHLLRGDAHRLPFKDEGFDLVYCRYVLEHVANSDDEILTLHALQENNILVLVLYPDCPCFAAVWRQFARLQKQLGGDALIGKKLLPLLKAAGFQQSALSIAPEVHYASTSTFRAWIENLIGNVRSGAEALHKHRLATPGEIAEAIAELQAFMERDEASAFFYWNRASGLKV